MGLGDATERAPVHAFETAVLELVIRGKFGTCTCTRFGRADEVIAIRLASKQSGL